MGKGQSIAGLVLGIVGIVLAILSGWFSIIALPVSIVGLVCSAIAGKKLRASEMPTGMATAGLVLSIIAVVFSTIAFFTCGLCVLCVAGTAHEVNTALNEANNALNNLL